MCAYTLAINNCFAVKRWPEPAAWTALVRERLNVDTVQFSLDLVELFVDYSVLERQARDIRRACAKNGLRLHSCFTGLGAYNRNMLLSPDADLRKAAFQWYRRALEFASLLGCHMVGGHLGSFSVNEYNDARCRRVRVEELSSSMVALSRHARDLGLSCLLVEPMPVARELTSTMDDTAYILQLLNEGAEVPVRLTLDLGHACAHGNSADERNPYAWLRRFGPQSPVVHLQQTDGITDGHHPFTDEQNATGIIRGNRVLQALHDSGADDTVLALEVLHAHEYPEAAVVDELEESVRYWNHFLR